MKTKFIRCLVWSCFIGGFLSTVYLVWALYRSRMFLADGHWPRSWPFPDKLIDHWERWLDVSHPAPPGFIKIDGEWDRLHFYLYCWITASVIVTLCGYICLFVLRRKKP